MKTIRLELPRPQISLSSAQQLIAALGAFTGIMTCGFVAWMLPTATAIGPMLVAPLGASAVLLFTSPASPMARPWAILAGNTLSAAIGVSCALYIPEPVTACAIALALSLALMLPLRCVHPASGAIALTAILGGPDIHNLGYSFVFIPIASTSLTLVLTAAAFNWAVGRLVSVVAEPRGVTVTGSQGSGA
jgi:CBS domain-containing membrane protein